MRFVYMFASQGRCSASSVFSAQFGKTQRTDLCPEFLSLFRYVDLHVEIVQH